MKERKKEIEREKGEKEITLFNSSKTARIHLES